MRNHTKWVSMWGNAMSIATHRPESYAKNITLRYPIYTPFDGSSLKFTFDNYCGTEPIHITCATVALASEQNPTPLSCSAVRDTFTSITFSGMDDVVIAPGESVVSDAISFSVKRGTSLLVSFYLADFTQMQSAVLITGPLSKAFYSISDQTNAVQLPVNDTKSISWFYFLSNIDILTSGDSHTILCYGDSITAQDWPDYLSLTLGEHHILDTAVIRRATSGSRILRQYDCITYDSYGLKGTNRFDHEIPTNGVDTIIIQQGINDIIHPVGIEKNQFRPMSDLPTADDLIAGMRWYIERARNYNCKVYVGTLLPIFGWRTYAPFREDLKNEFNDWIKSTDEIDGFIDFEAVLKDPQHKEAFRKEYDSGDHLHPSSIAYQKMAECAYEKLYQNK